MVLPYVALRSPGTLILKTFLTLYFCLRGEALLPFQSVPNQILVLSTCRLFQADTCPLTKSDQYRLYCSSAACQLEASIPHLINRYWVSDIPHVHTYKGVLTSNTSFGVIQYPLKIKDKDSVMKQNKNILQTFVYQTSIPLSHIVAIRVQVRLPTLRQGCHGRTLPVAHGASPSQFGTRLHFLVRGVRIPRRCALEFRKHVKVAWSQAGAAWREGASDDLHVQLFDCLLCAGTGIMV